MWARPVQKISPHLHRVPYLSLDRLSTPEKTLIIATWHRVCGCIVAGRLVVPIPSVGAGVGAGAAPVFCAGTLPAWSEAEAIGPVVTAGAGGTAISGRVAAPVLAPSSNVELIRARSVS